MSTQHAKPLLVLWASSIFAFIINIDYTVVNLAIVDISKDLDSDLPTIQWIISGYAIAIGALVVAAGRLCDMYGRRRMYLVGVWLFTITSILCGLSTSAWFLIGMRLLQGIGAALIIPAFYALVYLVFPEERRGWALGIIGIAIGAGLALGPTLGGFILSVADWRWLFFINGPLGLAVIWLLHLAMSPEPKRLMDGKLGTMGATLMALALGAGHLCLDAIFNPHLLGAYFWHMLVLGVVSTVLFLVHQSKTKHVLVSPALFKNQTFLFISLAWLSFEMIFGALMLVTCLFLQKVFAYPPLQAGYALLAMTLCFGSISTYGGKLCDRFGGYPPILVGMALVGLSLLMYTQLTLTSHLAYLLFALGLSGIGLGMAFPAFQVVMMGSIPEKEVSQASGVFALFGLMGMTSGTIITAGLLIYWGDLGLFNALQGAGIELRGHESAHLYQQIRETFTEVSQFMIYPEGIRLTLMQLVNQSFTLALNKVMALMSLSIAMALTIVVHLQRRSKQLVLAESLG